MARPPFSLSLRATSAAKAPSAQPGYARRENRWEPEGLRHAVLGIAVTLCLGGATPVWAGITDLYAPPASTTIGAAAWQGGVSLPGSPGAQPGCAPAVQEAHGAAYAAGVQHAMSVSRSERQPPGKILTGCISQMIGLLRSLDVFSSANPISATLQTIASQVVSYGEQLACNAIAEQFNQVAATAFNSVAFLNDTIPCGVGLSVPGMTGGGGGAGFCQAMGGPLVSIGVQGQMYTTSTSSVIPPVVSSKLTATGGGSVLGKILGR